MTIINVRIDGSLIDSIVGFHPASINLGLSQIDSPDRVETCSSDHARGILLEIAVS